VVRRIEYDGKTYCYVIWRDLLKGLRPIIKAKKKEENAIRFLIDRYRELRRIHRSFLYTLQQVREMKEEMRNISDYLEDEYKFYVEAFL
jgi:hypothetical protein